MAEANTSAPETRSENFVYSAGVWESPLTEGTNTIPIGQIEAMRQAS
jgi:hypothetical protein